MNNLKVAISGIHFPVTAALEYIVRAFKSKPNCEVRSIGPYPGLQIPWSKNGKVGMVMPEHYDFKPDVVLPYNGFQQSAPISYIETQLGEFKPDLWVDVNAGFYLEGRPKTGIRTTFLTDPHVLRSWYDGIKHNYNYVFCPQTPYAGTNEIYLPYAADAVWHSPMPEINKVEYDVTLIGNTYANRVDLGNRLRAAGRNIYFELGVAKDDARKIYAQSRVGVNWSSMQDLTARVFELFGYGVIPIINRVPDLVSIANEGVHYLGFDTMDQALERINYALAPENQEGVNNIAKNARNLIIEGKHTWNDRADTILEVCKLTN